MCLWLQGRSGGGMRAAFVHVGAVCSLLSLVIGAGAASAQTEVLAKRADGKMTPLEVYEAAGAAARAKGCAPLAVVSHGAGGSEHQLEYLGRALSAEGYTVVLMGHRESELPALRADMQAKGFMGGLKALVTDKDAESARLLDVGAALEWADARCHAPFRVLLGHSMGAETTMLEAGARNVIGVTSPPAGQDRFDAYVPLSPEGPGPVFPDGAWTGIRKPVLVITGTRDQSLAGGPEARTIPWKEMPADGTRGCHWMGVIADATHMDIGGNGNVAVQSQVIAMVEKFLDGVRAGRCEAPASTVLVKVSAK
jgi:predicted dienelactone hydrolase